jgi:molybdopterin converting factor small subunit
MNIKVQFFGRLREVTGIREREFSLGEEARLKNLIKILAAEYAFSMDDEIDKGLRILIDGQEYTFAGGMEAPLKDKGTIVFLPPIGGG